MRFGAFLFLAWPSMIPAAAAADSECSARSGPTTAALVELYTSEGCDSCPPADRWLSAFASSPRKEVVAVAFHVDYWDSLGWKDRFADARFSERQRSLARASGARAVYTPQVMLGGRDLSGWRSPRRAAEAIEAIQARPARAALEATLRVAGGKASVRVKASVGPGVALNDLVLFTVLTEDALSSRVTAGENRGATLGHDFVARGLHRESRWSAGTLTAEARLGIPPGASRENLRIATFVQDTLSGEVLQALSLRFC